MAMYQSYKDIIHKTYTALDLIPDLKKFLVRNQTVEYTMDEIEDAIYLCAYAGQPVEKFMEEHKEFFRGTIFNWLSVDEFLTYIKKRYPEVKWGSEIIERIWITEVGDP